MTLLISCSFMRLFRLDHLMNESSAYTRCQAGIPSVGGLDGIPKIGERRIWDSNP